MTRRVIAALGLLCAASACGGSEFVSDNGDAGANGGNAGTSAGSGGSAGTNGGSAGNSSGGSAVGGASGSAGTGGSGGSFDCSSMDCDDDNDCTTDGCDPSRGCEHEARSNQPCDDGIFCNGEDRCNDTTCENIQGSSPCNGTTTMCDEDKDTCVGCIFNSDCPSQTVSAWSNCMYDTSCAQAGTKTRSVTTYTCNTGTCKASTSMEQDGCNRGTDNQPCERDGNACTSDYCKGGACTHPALPDGNTCTDEVTTDANQLCCGGHCKSTLDDNSNCGGCFVKCGGTAATCSNGYCGPCGVGETDCDSVSPGMICTGNGGPGRCECDSDDDCPMAWQSCSTQGQCRGAAMTSTN